MIQKNSSNNQQQFIIEHTSEQCLEFFVNKVPLNRSNFPILQLTYTVWRSFTYEKIKKSLIQINRNISIQGIKLFYQISQKKYLPKYIQRIKAEMNSYEKGLKNVQLKLKQQQQNIPKKQQQIYEIIVELGRSVWQQQLYLQLIQDLMRLPYSDVISSQITVFPKPEYATDYIFRKKKQNKYAEFANNAGKNMFNKILNSLTTTMFSKTFVLKINTLFGTFNPLVMGATFGLSQYMRHLDKKNKELALQGQIKLALDISNQKVNNLKQLYESCLLNIELLICIQENQPQRQKLKKKIKDLFLKVFQQEWLHIQVTEAEDGWQVVKLQQKESFQDLTG